MADASAAGRPKPRNGTPGTDAFRHRAVSAPVGSLQPAAAAPVKPLQETGTPAANAQARTPAATDSPKDSLPILAPLKLAVTLAVMWFKLLDRVSGDINANVRALENEPRGRPARR